MTVPIVSVIMPAYNAAALIGETVASLKLQTFRDFEVVIVDDCSTDATLEVLRAIDDPRFHVIASAVNQGPVVARNTAVAASRGRYLAGLDHDDLCMPERFARQVAYLDANPATALVATGTTVLHDGAIVASANAALSTPALIDWLLRIGNPLVWSSVMMRGDMARQMTPFSRPERQYAEDFDFYHRIARHGRVDRIDDELLVYRRHPGGASQRHTETMRTNSVLVLAEAYAAQFGDDAMPVATLVVRHLMAQLPVPDRATLHQLGNALGALQRDFLERRATDAESMALIRWETARRWSHVARMALRAGTVSLADALAVRPDHLGLGHAGIDQLLVSRLIGASRVALRRPSRT